MTPHQTKKYWFPAKRAGWGWGWPVVWQGWAAYAAIIAGFLGAFALLGSGKNWAAFSVSAVLNIALILLMWLKGEPLRGFGKKEVK